LKVPSRGLEIVFVVNDPLNEADKRKRDDDGSGLQSFNVEKVHVTAEA
jgi:hypothetical protein